MVEYSRLWSILLQCNCFRVSKYRRRFKQFYYFGSPIFMKIIITISSTMMAPM
ncbi:hypothetical protein L873DRAFT_1161416 [Choiromyces venosus 120613-1]|uniref:Uncharacterized protein n=1 Tax=Choiromyces venosus 120613-1 TaxID=1336337 RepID=A0A3N4JKM5_9PEZI|nr:hypothetical protein L873DRAFT_1161416 [Choiromyces venosus 120613-1]